MHRINNVTQHVQNTHHAMCFNLWYFWGSLFAWIINWTFYFYVIYKAANSTTYGIVNSSSWDFDLAQIFPIDSFYDDEFIHAAIQPLQFY